MAGTINTFADISSLANAVQEDAIFVERNTNFMAQLVTVYRDMSGGVDRKFYQYGSVAAAGTIAESTDLDSTAFTPALLATLTPYEIGKQFFIGDLRMETESFESIRSDAGSELGFLAADKVESDLLGLLSSFTGGTIGSSGTTLTWGHFLAAAAQCRVANKSNVIPLIAVLHEYQWFDLAKASTIAGATVGINSALADDVLLGRYYQKTVAGVDIFVTPNSAMVSSTDAFGAVFPRKAIGLDWRRAIRIEGERDASRRGIELNMTGVYAKGLIRPTLGITIYSDVTAPTA